MIPLSAAARLDAILRALADPTRRELYRLIGSRPGQSTAGLVAQVGGMTRWGVMKHLGVLREAGLIQTLPEGRQRRHYAEAAALEPLSRWLASAEW
ncbi:hypothetical protein BH24CHL5_BH24CHL5_12530 [soil metagenome]